MRPVKAFGSPVMDAVGPMPYSQLNAMLDAAYPRGALNYWKSNFLPQLSDEAIDTMIDCFAGCPSPMGHILLEHFHGAAMRVRVATPPSRIARTDTTCSCSSEWMDPAATDSCVAWARETYAAM